MAELNSKSFTRIPTLTYIVRTDRFRNNISIRAHSATGIALTISTEATVPTFILVVRFGNYIGIRTYSAIRIISVTSIEKKFGFDYS